MGILSEQSGMVVGIVCELLFLSDFRNLHFLRLFKKSPNCELRVILYYFLLQNAMLVNPVEGNRIAGID